MRRPTVCDTEEPAMFSLALWSAAVLRRFEGTHTSSRSTPGLSLDAAKESGSALPHSKTLSLGECADQLFAIRKSPLCFRLRYGVRRCFAALRERIRAAVPPPACLSTLQRKAAARCRTPKRFRSVNAQTNCLRYGRARYVFACVMECGGASPL